MPSATRPARPARRYPLEVLRDRLRGFDPRDRDISRQRACSRPMCRFCSARRGVSEPVYCSCPTTSPSAAAISAGSGRPPAPGTPSAASPATRKSPLRPGCTTGSVAHSDRFRLGVFELYGPALRLAVWLPERSQPRRPLSEIAPHCGRCCRGCSLSTCRLTNGTLQEITWLYSAI